MTVKLYLVKRTDRDVYKRKAEWSLQDLRVVEGVGEGEGLLELKLELASEPEKLHWSCGTTAEREEFVRALQAGSEKMTNFEAKVSSREPKKLPLIQIV